MPHRRPDGTLYPSSTKPQVCDFCQKPGSVQDRVRKGDGARAHERCRAENLTRPRLLSRIVKTAAECWEWQGARHDGGYGQLRVDRVTRYTHRLAYEMFVGSVPDGLELHHLCRNRICCNPDHLEPVTSAENTRRSAPATKTHCVRGHEFSPENTYSPLGTSRRKCRRCNVASSVARKKLLRAEQRAAAAAAREEAASRTGEIIYAWEDDYDRVEREYYEAMTIPRGPDGRLRPWTAEERAAMVNPCLSKALMNSADVGQCWVWTGVSNSMGYGRTTFFGKQRLVHRAVYEELRGPIPEGLVLDHLCGTKRCFRPDHLDPVTQRVNSIRYHQAQTHCRNGHERTAENQRVDPVTGHRQCRRCCANRSREIRQQIKMGLR